MPATVARMARSYKSASIFAAQMKSFSDSPPTVWVQYVIVQVL